MYRANKYLWALLALVLMSGGVVARNVALPTNEPLESVFIMQVDGWITIDPQGKVADYHRDTTVPDNLTGPIEKAARSWLFKPVLIAGMPVQAKARMRITLAAQKSGDTYKVRVDNVTFPSSKYEQEIMPDGKPFAVKPLTLKPPRFPMKAAGLSGMVLLGVKIGLDGNVENCTVIQSSLVGKYNGPADLPGAIHALELSAIEGTKAWHFAVDTEHGVPTDERLTGTVTINYIQDEMQASLKPGKWHFESRTARHDIPWLPADSEGQRVGVSDSSSGGIAPVASAVQLVSNPIGQAL